MPTLVSIKSFKISAFLGNWWKITIKIPPSPIFFELIVDHFNLTFCHFFNHFYNFNIRTHNPAKPLQKLRGLRE
jgi:hypothetical protein